MKHFYCTICSNVYVDQCFILYESMLEFDSEFELFVLCIDNEAFEILDKINSAKLTLIKADKLENEFSILRNIKNERSTVEYAWTLKPPFVIYLLNNCNCDHVIYMDSDSVFFSDPQAIYDEAQGCSMLLTEQYYTNSYSYLAEQYGRFQAGFLGFWKDHNSTECLEWWKEKCFEWCYNYLDVGRWSDQRYINEWPELFKGVKISQSIGINLTPFILQRLYEEQEKFVIKKDDGIYINDYKVVTFHFYGFKYYNPDEIDLCNYWMMFNENEIKNIYMPYIYKYIRMVERLKEEQNFYKRDNAKAVYVRNYYSMSANNELYNGIFTIIDENNLINGLVLYESIRSSAQNCLVWICCMDEISYNTFKAMKLDRVLLIDAASVEEEEIIKRLRGYSKLELKNALKPILFNYILRNNFNMKHLLYADADMYFFNDPFQYTNTNFNSAINIFKDANEVRKDGNSYLIEAKMAIMKRNDKTIRWLRDNMYEWSFNIKNSNAVNITNNYEFFELKLEKDSWVKLIKTLLLCSSFNRISDNKIRIVNNKLYAYSLPLLAVSFSGFPISKEDSQSISKSMRAMSKEKMMICQRYLRTLEKYLKIEKQDG